MNRPENLQNKKKRYGVLNSLVNFY